MVVEHPCGDRRGKIRTVGSYPKRKREDNLDSPSLTHRVTMCTVLGSTEGRCVRALVTGESAL